MEMTTSYWWLLAGNAECNKTFFDDLHVDIIAKISSPKLQIYQEATQFQSLESSADVYSLT